MEAIRRCGKAYVDFGLSNAEGYRILFMGRGHQVPGVVDPSEDKPAAFAHVVEAVQRGIDAGRLRDGSAEVLALGLWAAVHGITSLLISLPNFPWPGERGVMIDHLIAQAIDGVLRRG